MGAKLYQVWLKRIYKKHNIYVGTSLDIKDDILGYLTFSSLIGLPLPK